MFWNSMIQCTSNAGWEMLRDVDGWSHPFSIHSHQQLPASHNKNWKKRSGSLGRLGMTRAALRHLTSGMVTANEALPSGKMQRTSRSVVSDNGVYPPNYHFFTGDKAIKIIEIDGIQFWKRDAKLKCFRSAVKRRKSQLAMVRQRQRDQLPEGTISIWRDTRDRLQETFPRKPFVSGGSPNIPKMTKIWPIHVWVHFNCWIGCLVQCVSMCWKE